MRISEDSDGNVSTDTEGEDGAEGETALTEEEITEDEMAETESEMVETADETAENAVAEAEEVAETEDKMAESEGVTSGDNEDSCEPGSVNRPNASRSDDRLQVDINSTLTLNTRNVKFLAKYLIAYCKYVHFSEFQ
jgi:hypothetical protein